MISRSLNAHCSHYVVDTPSLHITAHCNSFEQFKRLLKTYRRRRQTGALRNHLTYLCHRLH